MEERTMHRPKIQLLVIIAGAGLAALAAACGGGGQAANPAGTAEVPATTAPLPSPTATAAPPTQAPAPTATAVRDPIPTATAPAAPPTAAPPPTQAPPPPTAAPAGGSASAAIAAVNTLFSPVSLSLPAGSTVTLTFDNRDDGVTHDLIIFDPGGAQIAGTDLGTGPVTQVLTFALGAPGNYAFKCSVHPQQMRGVIAVQ
jgi:plastocyanin